MGAEEGMTDMQFKSYLGLLVMNLEHALKISPDNEEIIALIERLKLDLQG